MMIDFYGDEGYTLRSYFFLKESVSSMIILAVIVFTGLLICLS